VINKDIYINYFEDNEYDEKKLCNKMILLDDFKFQKLSNNDIDFDYYLLRMISKKINQLFYTGYREIIDTLDFSIRKNKQSQKSLEQIVDMFVYYKNLHIEPKYKNYKNVITENYLIKNNLNSINGIEYDSEYLKLINFKNFYNQKIITLLKLIKKSLE